MSANEMPERIWAWPNSDDRGWYAGGCSTEPMMDGTDGVWFTRSDLCASGQVRVVAQAALASRAAHPPQPSVAVVEAMKHLHDIINCGNCSWSRQSARLALRALKGYA